MSQADLLDAGYAQALAQLFAARRAGIDFGLERMRDCLQALALQHKPKAVVQIAGTNGKGSTSAFVAQILQTAGYRVGVFSSPHLLTICERFRIDGKNVSRKRFVEAHEAIGALEANLTFFEHSTGMAAWLFDDANVDVAIYEVGLGGRLDSTTAIPSTLSIVTGIGLDHCEFLGDSLEDIALEKAGIFRPGVPAILGLSASPSIRSLMASKAERPLWVEAKHLDAVPPRLALRGLHQRRNAACALLAARTLRDEQGLDVTDSDVEAGLATATLAGRMEEVEPGLWIDGAHNPQAAQALAGLLEGGPTVTLVVGLSNTKDIGEFLAPLRPHAHRLIATEGQGDRAYPAGKIADAATSLGFLNVEVETNSAQAVARARTLGGDVLVTGSLLLLGEVLSDLGKPGADPMVLTDPSKARS
jgi:dihydrofolate synthase/folylpolyglutamate synthase